MAALQEAHFNKNWSCDIKECGNFVRLVRSRHHCRCCGATVCSRHSIENVTLLSSTHQVPINFKRVCLPCHEKGVLEVGSFKAKSLSSPIEKSTVSVVSSDSFLQSFNPNSAVDHIDTQSLVTIVSTGIDASHLEYLQSEIDLKNSQIREISATLTRDIETKNARIAVLEAKVSSQAKDLQSVALLVEKRMSNLQSDIQAKTDLINELQMKNNNTEGDLANKDLEIFELRRQIGQLKVDLLNANSEVGVLREQSSSLMSKLVAKSTECQVLTLEEARLKAELSALTQA